MDWLAFFASVIGSLAWPVTLGALLYIIRDELPDLIKRIKGASVGGTKFEFGDALEKGRQEAEIVATERDLPHQPVYFLDERKLELAHKYPEAAIMEAYKEVEQVLLRVRDRLDLPSRANLRAVVRRLVEQQLVDAEVEPFFMSFRNARNAAVHPVAENAVSPAGAVEYLGQARLLVSIFNEALVRLNAEPAGRP